jgi:proton-translocating NADH-quinone oxidoreductase chain N
MEVNIIYIWFLLFPILSCPVIYIIGRLSVNASNQERPYQNPAPIIAMISLLITSVLLVLVTKNVFTTGQPLYYQIGSVGLRFDGISLLLSALVLFLGLCVTIYSFTYMKNVEGEEKFYTLLVAMIASISGLGSALDLFNLWVWFEAMTLTSIILVAFYRDQSASLEAGVKYLVQSAIGSVLVVIGIAFIFLEVGNLNLEAIRMAIQEPTKLLLFGGAFLIIGFGIKIALVPLHTWLPDAHSQAPSGISALLSGVVIEAGLIALLRALGGLANGGSMWGYILLGFACLNMLVGNLMALRQTEVKRLLAYSSLSHVGYMLLGFGVMIAYKNFLGGVGASFHLITHGLMKSLAFLAAGVLLYNLHLKRGDHNPLIVDDLNGISKRYPFTAFAFSVAVLSLGGLPPLAGFMSKWQIFVAGVETQNIWIIAIVIFAGLNSVLSLGYYAPMVNRIYRKKTSEIIENSGPVSIWMYIPIALLTLLVVALGFAPNLIYWLTGPSGASLFVFFSQ